VLGESTEAALVDGRQKDNKRVLGYSKGSCFARRTKKKKSQSKRSWTQKSWKGEQRGSGPPIGGQMIRLRGKARLHSPVRKNSPLKARTTLKKLDHRREGAKFGGKGKKRTPTTMARKYGEDRAEEYSGEKRVSHFHLRPATTRGEGRSKKSVHNSQDDKKGVRTTTASIEVRRKAKGKKTPTREVIMLKRNRQIKSPNGPERET